jgi:type I restriction enzyme S subunit
MLQLAVQGKLVPQDPNDEPATVLLEAIKAERDRLLKEKKLKSSERLSSISPDEVPLDLPKGWVWCRLGEICDIGTGTTPPKGNRSYYDEGKIPWVNSSLTSQSLITKTDKSISELAAKECRLRTYPRGSLIIALYGQGKTRGQVSELAIDATVNQACAAIVFFEPFLFLRGYVLMVLKEKYEELRGLAAGGAQPNLNVGKIKETLIPLPPKPEQQRIVNRVDVLRALCDELDTNLTHAGEASEEMVEVVVRNVVG